MIDETSLVEILSLKMGFPYVEPEFVELDQDLFKLVPYKVFMQGKFIPIKKQDHKVLVAFSDPLHKPTIENARQIFKQEIEVAISKKDSIDFAIQRMIREEKYWRLSMIAPLLVPFPRYSSVENSWAAVPIPSTHSGKGRFRNCWKKTGSTTTGRFRSTPTVFCPPGCIQGRQAVQVYRLVE